MDIKKRIIILSYASYICGIITFIFSIITFITGKYIWMIILIGCTVMNFTNNEVKIKIRRN